MAGTAASARSSAGPEDDPRIELQGAFNVRDLGGLVTRGGSEVRSGLVYRSDELSGLTQADKQVLFGDLGITELVDLRTAEEAGGDGHEDGRLFPGMETHHLSIMPEGRIGKEPFPNGDPDRLAVRYLANLDEGAGAVAATLGLIEKSALEKRPLLFHCAAGRDRTGLVAAVLLDLLEVEPEQIVEDYLASNTHAHHVTARLRRNPLYANPGGGAQSPTGEVDLLDARTMKRFLELLADTHGGGAGWARSQGIDVAVLRELLLTDPEREDESPLR